MTPKTIRAFVSSTFADLVDHRAAVRNVLALMSIPNFAMEVYVSEERAPLEKCLGDVRSSNVYIGIFAHRYGHVPSGQNKSITELEFREAGLAGIDRLIFLLNEGVAWNPQYLDSFTKENDAGERIRAFREELGQTKTVSFFSTPEDLSTKVGASVHAWCGRHLGDPSNTPSVYLAKHQEASELAEYLRLCQTDVEDFQAHYVPLTGRIVKEQPRVPMLATTGLWPSAFRTLLNNIQHTPGATLRHGEVETLLLSEGKGKRFLISAEAGAGKTIILRWMRLQLSKTLLETGYGDVPLYINLPEWPNSIDDFRSLIVHERTTTGCPAVPESNLFLLLDGLDELSSQRRLSCISKMTSWLDAHPETSCVIALRKTFPRESYPFQASVIEIQPMERALVEQFVSKLVIQKNGELLSLIYPDHPAINNNTQLSFLATNPFKLALVCAVFNNLQAELPTSLGRLMGYLVQALCQREIDVGMVSAQGACQFQDTLGRLAFALFGAHMKTVMYADWIRKRVTDTFPFNTLQRLGTATGLLKVTKNEKVVSFSHSIYQMYFLAEYVRRNDSEYNDVISVVHKNSVGEFPEHLIETFQLLMEVGNADEILLSISAHNPCLALAILNGLGDRPVLDSTKATLLIEQLRQFFESSRVDQFVVERYVRIVLHIFPEYLCLLGTSTNPSFRRSVLRILAESPTIEGLRIIVLGLSDKTRSVRREAKNILNLFARTNHEWFVSAIESFMKQMSHTERRNIIIKLMDVVCFDELVNLADMANISSVDLVGYASRSQKEEWQALSSFRTQKWIDILFEAKGIVLKKRRELESFIALTEEPVAANSRAADDLFIGHELPADEISYLIHDLGSVDADTAVGVVRTLISIGKDVCDPLVAVLHSDNEKLRRRAPRVLGALRYVSAIPSLIELLSDPRARVVCHALKALALMREPSIVWVFEEFVEHKNADVARHALRGLQLIGNGDALQISLRYLDDIRSEVRYEAVCNIAVLDPERFAEHIPRFLRNSDQKIQRRALTWLIAKEPLEGFKATLAVLRDRESARTDASIVSSIVDVLVGANAAAVGKGDASRRKFDASTSDAIADFSAVNWQYICDCFRVALITETHDEPKKAITVAFYRFLEWTNTFDRFITTLGQNKVIARS
jgi:HEAT repeat protein